MIGMMMSPTSEVTMPPNAAPMMTPTARSTTLPFIANSRNSLSICSPFCSTSIAVEGLVDEARMHHGAAHRHARGLGYRHHRQAHLFFVFAPPPQHPIPPHRHRTHRIIV